MFKDKKIFGTALISGLLSSSCGLVASANENMKDIPIIDWGNIGFDIIPKELSDLVLEIRSKLSHDGNLIKAAPLMEKAEDLVREHNLDIFLPWQDLTPYEALFDLSYCEDLDGSCRYLYKKKGIPAKVEEIINCETYYTNVIDSLRKNLRKGGTNDEVDYTKRRLVVSFKERELVRKKLALCVAKYDIELKKRFIDAGQKEDTNGDSNKKINSNSLVKADAVSNESWGFLDIVFGIKNKVKSLLGLKKEEKEFVSKEEDFKREAKRQETEFSLSLLVKRFLDFVRRSDSIGDRNENEGTQIQENGSIKLSKSPNLLTDGNVNGNQ